MFCDQLKALIFGPRDLINLSLAAYCTFTWPVLPLIVSALLREKKLRVSVEGRLNREKQYLEQVKEDFKKAHEAGLEGVAYVGLDHRFQFLNLPFAEIAGWPAHALVGKTFDEITYPEDLALDLENLDKLVKGEIDRYTMPKRYIAREGDERPIELTVTLHRNANGDPVHFISRIRPLTGGWLCADG